MIYIETVRKYCNGDITKIENYNEAIADKTQTWLCHHRLGIRPFSKKTVSHKKLIEYGLYYNQPPEALLFIKRSEHQKLHCKNMSDEWHENLSNAIKNQEENSGRFQKGSNPWHKGKTGVYSEEALEKMSKAKKGKPSPRKGVKLSKETKEKLSNSHKNKEPGNKGKKCFTNGEVIIYAKECPEGFVRGRKLCK